MEAEAINRLKNGDGVEAVAVPVPCREGTCGEWCLLLTVLSITELVYLMSLSDPNAGSRQFIPGGHDWQLH